MHLKTGNLGHGQKDNVSECYLKHCLKLSVNSTVIFVLKRFTLKYYFFFQLPLNECQKLLKGRIHGDWADIPGEDLNLVDKTKISTVMDYCLVISQV